MLFILSSLLLGGCSTPTKKSSQETVHNISPGFQELDEQYWYRYSFNIGWPEGAEINWPMDLLLAHAVVAPVLDNHIDDISYWRFHRRAARDQRGHSFTFMSYCTQNTAELILEKFAQSTLLEKLVEQELVTELLVDNPADTELANIEATSDRNWSITLQRNWPSFIMGVSALWLGLIDDAMEDTSEEYDDIDQLLQRYSDANETITAIWMSEGQNALLHHLSALFGYQPLQIRKFITF